MLGAAINALGAIIQSSSFSLDQLIVGRLVSGLGFGGLTATAPNWQSECSKAEHRGSVVLLEGLFVSMGLSIQAWITFGISHAKGTVTWRFPLALSALWSIIVIATTPNLPESPRWLIKKDRLNEARLVLAALDDIPLDSPAVDSSSSPAQADSATSSATAKNVSSTAPASQPPGKCSNKCAASTPSPSTSPPSSNNTSTSARATRASSAHPSSPGKPSARPSAS